MFPNNWLVMGGNDSSTGLFGSRFPTFTSRFSSGCPSSPPRICTRVTLTDCPKSIDSQGKVAVSVSARVPLSLSTALATSAPTTGVGVLTSTSLRLIFSLYTTGQLEAGEPELVLTVLAALVAVSGSHITFLLLAGFDLMSEELRKQRVVNKFWHFFLLT